MSFMKMAARAAVAVVLIGGAAWVPPAWPADGEIVIRANAIEPHVPRHMGARQLREHAQFPVTVQPRWPLQADTAPRRPRPWTAPMGSSIRPGTHPSPCVQPNALQPCCQR